MTETRHEALTVLSEICELSPSVRLGQILSHLDFLTDAHLGKHLVDIDDDELLAILYRHQAELSARTEGDGPNRAVIATAVDQQ